MYRPQDLRNQSIQLDSTEQPTQRISGESNKDTEDTQTNGKASARGGGTLVLFVVRGRAIF